MCIVMLAAHSALKQKTLSLSGLLQRLLFIWLHDCVVWAFMGRREYPERISGNSRYVGCMCLLSCSSARYLAHTGISAKQVSASV